MATNKKDLEPAYLIVGDDALKRRTVIERLRKRMEDYGDMSFNSDTIDAAVSDGAAVVAACNTVPFAAEKRLVYVRGIEAWDKSSNESLVSYLASPCETTVLALEAEKLAKNTRLFKAVTAVSKTSVIDCTRPKAKDLPTQVRSMAVSHGVTFTQGAAAKLVELAGEDTVRLDSEISKIALAHRGADAVNENEVIALVARTAQIKPWEFVNAFSARDLPKCMMYLGKMESSSPFALIAMCVARIRELMCAQSLMRRGSIAQLPKALKQPEWRVKNYGSWARLYSAAELRSAIARARDAEQAMKSGTDPEGAFIDWLVGTLKRP